MVWVYTMKVVDERTKSTSSRSGTKDNLTFGKDLVSPESHDNFICVLHLGKWALLPPSRFKNVQYRSGGTQCGGQVGNENLIRLTS